MIVAVPPNIDDTLTSSDIIVREGDNVTLRCKAKGSPEPSIKWKRDDGQKIAVNRSTHGELIISANTQKLPFKFRVKS